MTAWRKACGAMVASLLLLSTCGGAGPNDSDPKTAAAVDEVFKDLTKPGSPGCAVGVYRDGQMIYAKGYGLANLEENVAITPKSVFDVGSVSKQFTAASILLLEKQGKLSVSDDVRKYIPELSDYGHKITILQLLNHTSGLRDFLALTSLAGMPIDSVTTDADVLALIVRQKALNFPPGSEWLYSNSGFVLLSVIVKRVSGESLREFAEQNIFAPLGMTHTQYRDDHTRLIPHRALAYDPKKENGGYALDVSYFEDTGDGAIHTSVEDLFKWQENFYSAQIGGKESLAELQEQGRLNDGKVLDYAMGLFLGNYRGLPTVSHGGTSSGYRARLLRFPEQHFSVACLCNVGNADPTKRADEVADVYLGSLMKPKDQETERREAQFTGAARPRQAQHEESEETIPPAEQLQSYAGVYGSEELGVTYRLGLTEGKLEVIAVLDGSGLPRANPFSARELRSTGTDKFKIGGGGVIGAQSVTIEFHRDAKNAISGFTVDAGRTTGVIFARADARAK